MLFFTFPIGNCWLRGYKRSIPQKLYGAEKAPAVPFPIGNSVLQKTTRHNLFPAMTGSVFFFCFE